MKSVTKYARSGTVVRKGRSKAPLPGVCRFLRCVDLTAQMKEREQDFSLRNADQAAFCSFHQAKPLFSQFGYRLKMVREP